ncbi:hypothetical protein N7493_005816 [Penicillium malachiteum]|uniref:Ankyrin repeat protein n=1 Tax=Penicillium malachiteum TaxID=1324776 RepID=A0AAD6HL17_9EURO|nr:hypothetical protein N7493_005816 [Penicillium malachiteum]
MADPMSDAKDIPPDPEGSPSASTSYGKEEIKQAILQNNGALVEQILVKNPDLLEIRFDFSFQSDDYVTTGITPLIFAAFLGRYTVTKLLLSKGANLLTRTKSGGINAFLGTAMENFFDVGKLILEAGGPTQLDLRSTGRCNALSLVAWKDGVEYAQYLLDQGVDVRIVDEDEQTALHAAALSGNLPLAKILLEKDIGLLDMEDFWFQTPIILAATNEHFDVVQFFLEKGADTSKRDVDYKDVLHLALTKGHLETVKAIVERQVGSEQKSYLEVTGPDDQTPIMTAAWHGNFEIFQYLVSKGVDMTKVDAKERTLLHLAAEGGDLGIVKFIFENADQSKQSSLMETENIDGDTALLSAADYGHLEIVQYLLNKGAEIKKTSHQDWNALCLAAKNGRIGVVKFLVDHTALGRECISEGTGHDGSTPLMLAVDNGKLDVTSYFIEKGADTTKTDLLGNTLLHLAARISNTDMLEVLFENIPRGEQQTRLERPNNTGETPLEVATSYRNMHATTFFLAQGAQINTQGKIGEKMFQNAATCGHLELVQRLVDKRSDLLDYINEAEETGLSFASTGKIEVVEYLCTKGANVNFQQLQGDTALFRAIQIDSTPIVDYLMTQPIDFRLANSRGENILHYACEFGFPEIVAKVLDHSWSLDRHEDWKATVIARNIEGKTPLHCAITRTNVDISTILLFLESDAYFPSNPAQDKGLVCSPDEGEFISVWLERWIKIMARTESQRKLEAVIYWALLNNDRHIMTLIMELGKIPTLDRRGTTWLHVAALVGKTEMEGNVLLDSIPDWEDHLLEEMSPRNKATPFSIAVKEGNSDMVELFLDQIDSSDLLNLLVRVSKQEESLIWLAAINRKETTELLLWNSLFKIIKNETALLDFANAHGKDQEFLMGLAAWRYTTGIEYPFNFLMGHMEEISPLKTEQPMPPPTPLQLIVRHKFPVALWWLLSSGSYFGESHIKEGRSEMEQWAPTSDSGERNARKLIKSLLDHSPPERPLSNFETELLDFRFRDSISAMQEGTVVDLSISDQNNITIQFAQTSMEDIVYTKGPDQIMRENKNYSLQDIDNELFGARINRKERQKKARLQPKENTGTGKQEAKERRREEREVAVGSEQKSRPQRRVRWIHVPVNNDLMVRITQEKNMSTSAQQSLREFLWRSRTEISAGGRDESLRQNCYMKPQCETIQNTLGAGDQLVKNDSLQATDPAIFEIQMPYLLWGREPGLSKGKDNIKNISPQIPGDGLDFEVPPDKETSKALELLLAADDPAQLSHNDRQKKSFETMHTVDAPGLVLQPRNSTASAYPKKRISNGGFKQQGMNGNIKRPIHTSLTLDQYYYTSLSDTMQRDRSQVVGRYFERLRKDLAESSKCAGHDGRAINKVANSVAEPQILMVNQLWLWTLHDDLIITSTTQQPPDFDPTFLQRALRVLRDQSGNSTFTARQIVDFILHTARDLFDAQEIETRLSTQEKKSPLEIFRESLQNIRDEEADLFTRFMNSLGPNKNRPNPFKKPNSSELASDQNQEPEQLNLQIATAENHARGSTGLGRSILSFHGSVRDRFRKWKKSITESAADNRYEDIHREIDLLYQVKDILDELNMLKNLAQDQEHIHSLWKGIELGKGKDAGAGRIKAEKMDLEMKKRDIEIEWKELEVERKEIELTRKATTSKASDAEDGQVMAIEQRAEDCDKKEIEIYKKEIILKKREREIMKAEIGTSDLPRKSEWNPPVTPRERVNEIQRMIADAQSVQSDITSLLDLKQKEATIIEAQATRRQSDSVMVFTVVTVVFLPASFLASLFALNVVEYPHQGDSVVFQGRWIFPIIFGVTLAFSLVFVPLAFNATIFKNFVFGKTGRGNKLEVGYREYQEMIHKAKKDRDEKQTAERKSSLSDPKKQVDEEMGLETE